MKLGSILASVALGACVTTSSAFVAPLSTTVSTRSSTFEIKAKGFGAEPEKKKEPSAGSVDRQQKRNKYDEIAATGGQEYNIFVRQFGSDDSSWLPTGSIAVPRGAQVSDAVFSNEEGLKTAIVRTYPKLRGNEGEMEFGYNLKVYPDDPIEVCAKTGGISSGPSIGNWISNLLSPIDASAVKQPPIKE